MYWGQPWTAPWGAPDNTVRELTITRLASGHGAVLRFAPAAGFGDSWQELFVQDRRAAHFFAPEGGVAVLPVMAPPAAVFTSAPVGFALYGVGGWSCPPYSLQAVHLAATGADRGRRARLTWAAGPALDAIHGDSAAQLSGWSLTGVERGRNVARVADQPTRGRLYFRLIDTAGDRTVTLFADADCALPVATGTRTGDGVIPLVPLAGSGLTGAVTVAYSTDIGASSPGAAWLDLRWPARVDIFSNGGAGALDFTAPLAQLRDNGRDTAYTWISAELPAGSWEFCLRAVSDTGISASNSAAQATLAVVLPPEPPGMPTYLSGDAATGVTLQFAAAPTVGASYRLYRSLAPDQTSDTAAPDATAPPGATQITTTPLTGGAGRYSFLLVSVTGAGESLNAETITLILTAAGAVEAPLPPTPTIADFRVAGREVSVQARFRADDAAAGAAAVAWVDFYRVAETAAIDWTAPVASAAPVAGINGWQQAAADLPAAMADGWYRLGVRCRTAAGNRDGNTFARSVYLSAAAPATVSPTAALIR